VLNPTIALKDLVVIAKISELMENTDHSVLEISGDKLTVEDIIRVGNSKPGIVMVKLSKNAEDAIRKSREFVNEAVENKLTIYGLNTGFGSQAENVISSEDVALLQRYLIVSHSAGVGEPFSPELIRASMLVRANTLAKGNSGIRIEVVQALIDMINKGVVPFVPRKGSLGASGDLAPLSHIALVMTRDPRDVHIKIEDELAKKASSGANFNDDQRRKSLKESGEAYFWSAEKSSWERMTGIEAMAKAGIKRIILSAKEGLALNNGSTVSAAMAAYVVHYGENLQRSADIIAALTTESVKGFESAFYEGLHAARPHPGQIESARRIRDYLKSSGMVTHIEQIQNSRNVYQDFKKVQDSYSIRCIPQVHGPVIDTLKSSREMINMEINSATDNPLIIQDNNYFNKSFSGGNFHGQYISLYMDNLGTALGILGNIAERRIFKLVTRNLSEGLPGFLVSPSPDKAGLMNGAMILQYTAAHLASENKVFSHPASSDSIPSCEDKEDFVSMAPIAASKALVILENSENILAIELWCDIIALRIRMKEGLTPSDNAKKILSFFKDKVADFDEDRVVYDEVRELKAFIHNEGLLSIIGQ
jgi:histidine ammonia-lyase